MYEIYTVMPIKPEEKVTGYQGTQSTKTQLGEVGSVGNTLPFTGMQQQPFREEAGNDKYLDGRKQEVISPGANPPPPPPHNKRLPCLLVPSAQGLLSAPSDDGFTCFLFFLITTHWPARPRQSL